MIVDRALVLIVSLVLSVMIILYIILVMKFFLRKARQKTKNEYDEPATTSFLDHFTMWHPRKFASTKCIPVQPRTYEELQRSEEKLAETGPATTSPDKSAGKIKFSLQYDSMRSTLMVIIHKVQLHELPSNENGDINYYVTIKILPLNHRSFQTKAVRHCNSPEFKEKFEFRVAYEKLQVQSLKMTLCCFDRFSQHEPLGDHTVHLAELEARGLSLSREILLFRDIHAAPKASGVLGELMISLGYLRLTERLTIVIIRARNLPQAEEAELDPAAYVEVSLIHESRVLKQKKTLTKDPSGNPVFNETLTFHIPVGILHQTSLLVAVKNENAQRTEDQLLGRIFLGPTATGNQFEHWNEMRINNKPIARWHKLLD